MSYLRLVLVLSLICSCSAVADVWTWQDHNGNTHYVETNTAIFTWVDKSGRVFYSDAPDHEDAVAVRMVWFSKGSLKDINSSSAGAVDAGSGETPEEAALRRQAAAHDCKRVTEVYDSYRNAPRLYRTNDAGEKEYLSKADARATLREARAKQKEFCK